MTDVARHIYCRYRFETEVPFFDVDAMNIVWHGHYVKYLEMARCAFLSFIGYDYTEMARQGYSWPVVQLNVKYVRPARFGQKIRVDVAVVEYESCLKIRYTVADADSGTKLTQAETTQVAVPLSGSEMLFQTPESWRNAIEQSAGFRQPETA